MRKIRDLTISAVKLNNRKKLAAGNYKGSFPRDSSTTLGMTVGYKKRLARNDKRNFAFQRKRATGGRLYNRKLAYRLINNTKQKSFLSC